MRIVFLGTPDFAVATLEELIALGFNVVAVVTAPDRPSGRGLKMKQSAVAESAEKHGIPVLKPEKLKNPEFLHMLKEIKADVQVVVAFRMLPELVWNMPPKGTYNLHASLLPQYRGAAPINHAIIQGEKITGVTTFKLIHEIDKGSIALQKEIPIGIDTTAGELHDEMMVQGAKLMSETLKLLENDTLELKPQASPTSGKLKEAPKLSPEFCRFNKNMFSLELHNFIRGLSPYPGVNATLNEGVEQKQIKLYCSALTNREKGASHKGDLIIEKDHIYICMQDGLVEILELQPAGKRRMLAKEYLNGLKSSADMTLE
ncbi:MAG: methionyl-tRNA formyltransferase [Bacteroidia bacterium]